MATAAVSSVVAAAPLPRDWVALEGAVHGRPRDASRAGEAWLGVVRSLRTIRVRRGTTDAAALAERIGARGVEAGLAERVLTASVEDLARARDRGMRRALVMAAPCDVLAVRLAEEALGFESLYVLGTVAAPSATAPGEAAAHDCPACGDRFNALADISLGAPVAGAAPWAIVRNTRGRALLDALVADVWLDAVPAAEYRATAEAAAAAAQARMGRRPRVIA